MIARLTRLMILFQLATLILITVLLKQLEVLESWPLAVIAAALLLTVLRASIIFNNFFLSRALRQPCANGQQPGTSSSLAMMLQEFWFSMRCWFRLFPFAQPYAHHVDTDISCPVVLLHGYGANSGFWQQFHHRLQSQGISHCAINLEPVLGSIDEYAPRIEAAVREMLAEHTAHHKAHQVIVVAHSMGGLAARAWLRRCGMQSVARVITLGTPHAGSLLAGYGIGINARQMLPVSAWRAEEKHWLSELAASEDAAVRALFLSVWSRHDNIVAPQISAELPGADHVALDEIGHVALGFDKRVVDLVLEEINAVRRSRPSAGHR